MVRLQVVVRRRVVSPVLVSKRWVDNPLYFSSRLSESIDQVLSAVHMAAYNEKNLIFQSAGTGFDLLIHGFSSVHAYYQPVVRTLG